MLFLEKIRAVTKAATLRSMTEDEKISFAFLSSVPAEPNTHTYREIKLCFDLAKVFVIKAKATKTKTKHYS